MKRGITFVGMDVHQKTIDISTAEQGHDGKVTHFGCIGGDLKSLDKAVEKLRESGAELRFVYEAGPCGFVIYRHLKERGLECTVVSPASVPKKASDRVKTDRRDARTLAIQHRAGTLRAVYVPEPEDEAIRDLVRAREDAVEVRRQTRQRLNAFLLRQGRRYTAGKKKWTRAYRLWLADQRFEHTAQRITLEEYVAAHEEAERRVERLSEQVRAVVEGWRYAPYVKALQTLRGVSWVVAVTVMAEVGDLRRFTPARLMGFLGLVPSEYSSGERRRQGAITKSGNAHVRRVLCEAAWAYVHRPAISRALLARQEGLPKEVRDIGWKAQLRLCGRFAHLSARGKHRNKINTAIARELVGFMWDIARHVAGEARADGRQAPQRADVYVLRGPRRTQSRRRNKAAGSGAHEGRGRVIHSGASARPGGR